jgi:phenylpropionate dioxygenase-like ring-hydroxylating dioxygenase large terminal subunit
LSFHKLVIPESQLPLLWNEMSWSKELQELQDKRSKLEGESLSLKEQQKKLEERTKALEQKIMEELRSKNEETRQYISHLESRINDLEQRLGQIAQKTKTNEPIDETASQTPTQEAAEGLSVEINAAVLEEHEESVTVTPVNDSSTAVEKDNSETHQGSEKKKRRFL